MTDDDDDSRGEESSHCDEWHIGEDGLGAKAEKLLRSIVRFHRLTNTAPPAPHQAAVILAKARLRLAAAAVGDGDGDGAQTAQKKEEESVVKARASVARAEARRDRAAQAQLHSSFLDMHDDDERLWSCHVKRRVLQVYARHQKKDAELEAKDLNALCNPKLPLGFISRECRKMAAAKGGQLRRIAVKGQQQGRFAVRAIEAVKGGGRKRKRGDTTAATSKHLAKHLKAIEDLSGAKPFPHIQGASDAAAIFAEHALMSDVDAKRGVMAIELLNAKRLGSSEDLQALKEQCSEKGVRLLVVRGAGLGISLWLDIAFGLKCWEFRALPLPHKAHDQALTSIRDVQSNDMLVLTCKETGDKLSATVGRRVRSWNVEIQQAETNAATEDGADHASGAEVEEEDITVRVEIIDD